MLCSYASYKFAVWEGDLNAVLDRYNAGESPGIHIFTMPACKLLLGMRSCVLLRREASREDVKY